MQVYTWVSELMYAIQKLFQAVWRFQNSINKNTKVKGCKKCKEIGETMDRFHQLVQYSFGFSFSKLLYMM